MSSSASSIAGSLPPGLLVPSVPHGDQVDHDATTDADAAISASVCSHQDPLQLEGPRGSPSLECLFKVLTVLGRPQADSQSSSSVAEGHAAPSRRRRGLQQQQTAQEQELRSATLNQPPQPPPGLTNSAQAPQPGSHPPSGAGQDTTADGQWSRIHDWPVREMSAGAYPTSVRDGCFGAAGARSLGPEHAHCFGFMLVATSDLDELEDKLRGMRCFIIGSAPMPLRGYVMLNGAKEYVFAKLPSADDLTLIWSRTPEHVGPHLCAQGFRVFELGAGPVLERVARSNPLSSSAESATSAQPATANENGPANADPYDLSDLLGGAEPAPEDAGFVFVRAAERTRLARELLDAGFRVYELGGDGGPTAAASDAEDAGREPLVVWSPAAWALSEALLREGHEAVDGELVSTAHGPEIMVTPPVDLAALDAHGVPNWVRACYGPSPPASPALSSASLHASPTLSSASLHPSPTLSATSLAASATLVGSAIDDFTDSDDSGDEGDTPTADPPADGLVREYVPRWDSGSGRPGMLYELQHVPAHLSTAGPFAPTDPFALFRRPLAPELFARACAGYCFMPPPHVVAAAGFAHLQHDPLPQPAAFYPDSPCLHYLHPLYQGAVPVALKATRDMLWGVGGAQTYRGAGHGPHGGHGPNGHGDGPDGSSGSDSEAGYRRDSSSGLDGQSSWSDETDQGDDVPGSQAADHGTGHTANGTSDATAATSASPADAIVTAASTAEGSAAAGSAGEAEGSGTAESAELPGSDENDADDEGASGDDSDKNDGGNEDNQGDKDEDGDKDGDSDGESVTSLATAYDSDSERSSWSSDDEGLTIAIALSGEYELPTSPRVQELREEGYPDMSAPFAPPLDRPRSSSPLSAPPISPPRTRHERVRGRIPSQYWRAAAVIFEEEGEGWAEGSSNGDVAKTAKPKIVPYVVAAPSVCSETADEEEDKGEGPSSGGARSRAAELRSYPSHGSSGEIADEETKVPNGGGETKATEPKDVSGDGSSSSGSDDESDRGKDWKGKGRAVPDTSRAAAEEDAAAAENDAASDICDAASLRSNWSFASTSSLNSFVSSAAATCGSDGEDGPAVLTASARYFRKYYKVCAACQINVDIGLYVQSPHCACKEIPSELWSSSGSTNDESTDSASATTECSAVTP